MRRTPARPPGWTAPGPAPRGPGDRADLAAGPDEDLSYLVGDFRIFQRKDGHRWSLDDLVTAHLAARHAPPAPRRLLDLGCGIGSVLMSMAWRFPDAPAVGIEAQAVSAALCRRSLAYNGCDGRVELREGDFRDPQVPLESGGFDVITGTPPYFPRGEGVESTLPQKAPCRFEHRGGVEAYLAAARHALAPGGRFTLVAAHHQAARVAAGAAEVGLRIVARTDVIPRAGKPPLLCLHVCARADDVVPPASAVAVDTLTIRDAASQWTPAFLEVRAAMGLPPPMAR